MMAPIAIDQTLFVTRESPPSHFLFRIESFSSLLACMVDDQRYVSREFESGGYNWRFIFCDDEETYDGTDDETDDGTDDGTDVETDGVTDGVTDEITEDQIIVGLAISDPKALPANWEIHASCNICFYNQNLDKFAYIPGRVHHFHAMKPNQLFSISKKFLKDPSNGYVVQDICVIGADVFVISNPQLVIERLTKSALNTPLKFTWRINNFSQLGDEWQSEEFTAGGYKWKLGLHPKGSSRVKGHHVSIFIKSMENFGPHKKIAACMQLQLNNQLKKDQSRAKECYAWFSSACQSWGFLEFMTIDRMNRQKNGFLVGDCCILELEVCVKVVAND